MAVYVHRDPTQYVARLSGERIHRGDALELWAMDRSLLSALIERLDRRMSFSLSISERELFVSLGTETFSGKVTRLAASS